MADAVSNDITTIPNKLYFRIGEVSRLTGLEAYVLRFWESEFPALNPKKSGTGQRLYRRKDVEMVFQIKHLLYDKRYTIEGARQALAERKTTPQSAPKPMLQPPVQESLFSVPPDTAEMIRRELREILDLLK
jgi:DNA-binding transcriptional MerR regulator